ncbi:MAG: hypothetical protein RMK18_11480 [Armatimonadota bacterium]|nr:hypothetical protein [Armatimonadota bacterium]MCX7777532.1 hypothetical protein [Armatimonadota bacterium]MDW8026470.1 hypothetical protein [Armatimonadota bacterium]
MSARRSLRREAIEEAIGTVLNWLFLTCTVIAVLALLYLLYGILSGAITRPRPGTPEMARTVMITGKVSFIFLLSASVGASAALIRYWEIAQLGPCYLIGGVAAYIGMPLLIQMLLGGAGTNEATDVIVNAFNSLAIVLVGGGLLRSIVSLIYHLIRKPPVEVRKERGGKLVIKPKEKIVRARPWAFSPCWKLPFCSESMRRICPVFQKRRSCWRLKQGCQCDPMLIEALLGGLAVESAEGGQTVVSLSELEPERRQELIQRRWQRKVRKKAPCDRCTIFMYHQQLKHQLFSPLILVAIPIAFYFLWQPYLKAYGWLVQLMSELWKQIAYEPAKISFDPTGLMTPIAQVFVAIVIGAYVLLYATRFLEFVVFKLRL